MQLFIIVPEVDGDKRIFRDSALLHQVSRVLRMKAGDSFFVQYEDGTDMVREELSIELLDKKHLICRLLNCKKNVKKVLKTTMIVSVPNSAAKAELIVQKLTEIGVGNIVFRRSQRSQAKFDLAKKHERLQSIIKEAVEQSRGWHTPALSYITSLSDLHAMNQCIVCDTLNNSQGADFYNVLEDYADTHIYCLIGPEGGRGERDYEDMRSYKPCLLELGSSVLRMETAAIVAGRKVVNNFSI